MVESALTELVGKYNEGSIAHLTILGLKKVKAGVCGEKQNVVVAINGRPLTTCYPEHCCISYYYYERKSGCTKGLSKIPKLFFSQCHPIRTVNFQKEQAKASLFQFVKEVEAHRWMRADLSSSTSATTPAATLAAGKSRSGARKRRHLPTNTKSCKQSKRIRDELFYTSSKEDDNPVENLRSSSVISFPTSK
jgi:hypothetical protein